MVIALYLCCVSLQKPRETHPHLRSCRTNHPLIAPARAGRLSTREVDRKSGHLADPHISFSTKKKPRAVFVDFTAVYDSVWHRGLTCKLLWLLPYKHMEGMAIEMVGNRSFNLTIGKSKRSKLQRFKNGDLPRSVLAPLLFNICIPDLPTTVSRKYAYADDLAIMHVDGNWQVVEAVVSTDTATVGEYQQTWKLKLSTTKTMSAAFHLNKK